MKLHRSTLATLGVCLLALALGAFAGGRRPRPAPLDANRVKPEPSSTRGAAAPSDGAHATPTATTESSAKRWLTLFAALEKATADDMPALLQTAGDDSTMLRLLGEHWARLDPAHLFRWVYSESLAARRSPAAESNRKLLADILFQQWTKSDLPAALAALNTPKDFPGREQLRVTAVRHALKQDVERALLATKEWQLPYGYARPEVFDKWAAADPRHAAEVASQVDGSLATHALRRIGQAWVQTDPAGGLQYAATLAAKPRAVLAGEMMQAWAERDLAAAAQFAAAQDDLSFRAALGKTLAQAWGKTDPAAALAWSQQNLRGVARNEAISSLVDAAAGTDLHGAAELVAGMEPGGAQNLACASIFATWFGEGGEQREAAFDWLAALPDPAARRAALDRVQWTWALNEPDAVRDFVTGPHGALATDSLVQFAARREAAKNPEAAMRWADSLPPDRAATAREAALQSWLGVRPESAAAYSLTLPPGADRSRAIEIVAATLAYGPAQEAANWFRKLPGADQTAARRIFDGMPEEQRKQFTQALKR